eukprot:SAG31_NODE_879_length_11292_cov_49.116680_5_plen_33_part_00
MNSCESVVAPLMTNFLSFEGVIKKLRVSPMIK